MGTLYRLCKIRTLNVDEGNLIVESEDKISPMLYFQPFFGFTNLKCFKSFDIAVDHSDNIFYVCPSLPTMAS
jgi:hypothetical protein